MTVENKAVVVLVPVGIVSVDFQDFGNEAPAWTPFQMHDDVHRITDVGFDRASLLGFRVDEAEVRCAKNIPF